MNLRRSAGSALFAAATLLGGVAVAGPASASGPVIDHEQMRETFFDDFVFELCGIETYTTLTQRFTVKTFADGSEQVQVVRTYVPDDPRIPIEKGAGSSFTAPDGTRTVVGKPIQLMGAHGKVRLLDAGLVSFADELVVRGPHPSLVEPDLAPYYCPSSPT
ncbi:MAG TPA: hypothetical protein VFL99_03795 [Segeticoccus sp.]|uniref:hypothetical protein n=1 Tax=Segeticoccus sp. TaxID=2706531 RepID=UPI002D7F7965|nr:hypothetical protein [Segeticoccus sp.]HET8599424.1 hypothetical protein [Segeticoccus sp.]